MYDNSIVVLYLIISILMIARIIISATITTIIPSMILGFCAAAWTPLPRSFKPCQCKRRGRAAGAARAEAGPVFQKPGWNIGTK